MKHLKAVSPNYDAATWERERLANKKIMERLRTVRRETLIYEGGVGVGGGKARVEDKTTLVAMLNPISICMRVIKQGETNPNQCLFVTD